jgi:DnaJ-class molecular chaperone
MCRRSPYKEFTKAYFELTKRYHPDVGNQRTHELMANINAARTNVLQVYFRALNTVGVGGLDV